MFGLHAVLQVVSRFKVSPMEEKAKSLFDPDADPAM